MSAEGQAVANSIGAAAFIECSAKTGEGVEEVFNTAVRIHLQVIYSKSFLKNTV